LRQKLINDKYLAEAANFINLPNFLNVGNQKNLKYIQFLNIYRNNTKVLAESVKALIGA
jgi:dsRNA-specific ribonuclease